MKIHIRIASIILCFAIIFSLPLNTLADDLSVEIVDITNDATNVYIVCKMTGTMSNKLTLICRGEDNSVLHIDEYNVMDYGYFELFFPIDNNYNSQLYTVSIGGNDFNTLITKSFYINNNSSPQYILIKDESTVKELKNTLKNNNACVYRNNVLLGDNEFVNSLDTISLFNGSSTVNRQAVVLGDVDLDGNIDTQDALWILHHVVKKISLSKPSLMAANVLYDGTVVPGCALKILNYILGKINEF